MNVPGADQRKDSGAPPARRGSSPSGPPSRFRPSLDSPGVIGTEFTGDDVTPSGAAAMFELQGGLTLALYPRTELAKDANLPLGAPRAGEFSIGHVVSSKADVDAVLARAEAAGATLTDRPHDRPWGIYSGYFRDLEGHLWEIIWNPRR